MLLIIGALINMKIKVVNIVIHDATVDKICFSIAEMFQHRGKTIDVLRAGGWGNVL